MINLIKILKEILKAKKAGFEMSTGLLITIIIALAFLVMMIIITTIGKGDLSWLFDIFKYSTR